MANPTQRKKRSRLTRIILLPALVPIFVIGWSLYWIGQSKNNPKHPKHRPNNKTPKKQEEITIGVISKEELTIPA
jgi:hypothetical protein